MILSAIDTLNPDQFFRNMTFAYKPESQPLEYDQRKFDWIFRNMDYTQWHTTDRSGMLWLAGPPECHIHKASSHIVEESKKKSFVLHFFCSTAAKKKSIEKVFVHTLLHQIICNLPPLERKSTITLFFRALVNAIPSAVFSPNYERGVTSWYNEEDPPDITVKNALVNLVPEYHWDALKVVLDTGEKQELSIIVDRLDDAERQTTGFTKKISEFIAHLQERFSKVKVLLTSTSYSQADIAEILGGMSYTYIEYDKERKVGLHL